MWKWIAIIGGIVARQFFTSRTFIRHAGALAFNRAVKISGGDKGAAQHAFQQLVGGAARAIGEELSAADERLADEVFEKLWDQHARGQFKAAQVKLGKAGDRLYRFADALSKMPDPMGRGPEATPPGGITEQAEAARKRGLRPG